ncbi:nuclear import and export protein [Rutstroemia sp. NJR-2017a BBW]|nr:nuclear import and export protein [Rutstroemia sp. NJR-2017a BBW]
MNGSANGHSIGANRDSAEHTNGNTALLSQIHEALELVHSPYSSNESRKQASIFLENIKADDEAPTHGFTLASDKAQQPIVRHYALSLLEHAIRHKWAEYSPVQASALRGWVLQLSQNVAQDDPLYLRNKTAQLWVEVAKRSWGGEWKNMDELLVNLWELPGPVVHKEFVLFVLETLSDEVFNGEDAITVLREGVLSKACVEIFTPAAVLSEVFPNRQPGTAVRYGDQGWLVRLGELLGQCLNLGVSDAQYQSCAVKILAVYKSVVPWAVPKAISSAQCVESMCKCLATSSTPVQLAAVQALFALYSRLHFSDEEFLALVCPMYTSEVVDLLRKLYEWSMVDPRDIDDEKYLFAKKFSEPKFCRFDTHSLNMDQVTTLGGHWRIPHYESSDCTLTRTVQFALVTVDKYFTVIEAALKGYMKWRAGHGSNPQRDLAVAFSTTALDQKVGFMLKVLEHILMTQPAEHPNATIYSDAVKELQADAAYELQRLATKMPDQLLAKVSEIVSSGNLDKKRQTSYQTFLFTIIHRASKIDPDIRLQKLKAFLEPVQRSWQNPEMDEAISSFGGFCSLLGLDRVRDFLVSRRVHEIQDWGQYQLDAEAQSIQKDLEDRLKAIPLRTTKSFLGCSTEKLEKNVPAYEISRTLWRDTLPVILPNLLKFLSHAHAFHNPANWTGLPPEMGSIVGRILTDRFWQAGISTGSKDDFYARVTGTKSTMEGFASSIRGSIRTVREACYSILYSMSRLDVDFYGFSELPGPLAHALFADAHCLSSHQLIALLNVVRLMVDDCPVEVRSHFVPPVLASCFSQMDTKCSSEWENLAHKQVAPADGDTLTEEMKEESILRQLTHTAVMMIAGFLDPARINVFSKPASAKEASTYNAGHDAGGSYPSLRKFCLGSSTILEPLLLFLTHAIRMRDTRCCGVVLRVFRSIVPEFGANHDSPLISSIREFISTEVLKAAISSLNEPYFVDLHKDLAQLIASILLSYSPVTSTPRQILASLPGIQEKNVDSCIQQLAAPGAPQRHQRLLVLDLLRDLKGVSISEQGRISKPAAAVRKERSKMQQEFLKEHPEGEGGKSLSNLDDLEGVAGLFDG